MENFIEILSEREMLHSIMPGMESHLKTNRTGYIGFDPTADSLHIGNLATIMMLVHFQNCGHTPIILIGGATAMIGDPSGKSSERNILSRETISKNQEALKLQLEKFLSFEGENAAQIHNNFDWFSGMNLLDFLRDTGKHINIVTMLTRDSVKSRMESGISFTEFSYQLLQGFDFYHLINTINCTVQLGGSDQWGNMVSGTELIKKTSGKECFAATCPLVTKSDGSKFGKSEKGNIWLEPNLTSIFDFFQFWMQVTDVEAPKLLKIFTLFKNIEIDALIAEHLKCPENKLLQKTLANDICTRVHGAEATKNVNVAIDVLFGKLDVNNLPDESFELLTKELETTFASKIQFNTSLLNFLTSGCEIFPSKRETRTLISSGAISINGKKILPSSFDLPASDVINPIHDKWILIKKGKKHHFLIMLIDPKS